MLVRTPYYYSEFKCIAGACTDTCCAGWQVDVDDRSFAYYKMVQGEFGERLHSVMVEGKRGCEGQFRIREDGRCPFLNDANLCDLYAELGEDALCVTCDQYPRYICEFGNLRETGIALSCMTAAELILRDNRTPGFVTYEDEESYPALNDIDGSLFMGLMRARERAYAIVWDRGHNVRERMIILLEFANQVQKNIRKPDVIKELADGWEADGARIADSVEALSEKETVGLYRRYWRHYMRQVIIKREWPMLYEKAEKGLYKEGYAATETAFAEDYQEREYEYENILTYFVFRYFMKGVFDGDVLTKVKIAVVSTLMIMQCDMAVWKENGGRLAKEEQIEIAHLYSREVEHSEKNFAALCRIFARKREFRCGAIEGLCKGMVYYSQ